MMSSSFSAEQPGDGSADAEDQHGGAQDQGADGDQPGFDQLPVFQDVDRGGNEENGQDGSEEIAHILDLLQLHDAHAKGQEKQHQAVNGSGDGQRQQPLECFTHQGEAHDDTKLR